MGVWQLSGLTGPHTTLWGYCLRDEDSKSHFSVISVEVTIENLKLRNRKQEPYFASLSNSAFSCHNLLDYKCKYIIHKLHIIFGVLIYKRQTILISRKTLYSSKQILIRLTFLWIITSPINLVSDVFQWQIQREELSGYCWDSENSGSGDWILPANLCQTGMLSQSVRSTDGSG